MRNFLVFIQIIGFFTVGSFADKTPPPLEIKGRTTMALDDAVSPLEPLKLWYAEPATEWTKALPIGNGRLGAMVYGGVQLEQLQLNEETLWSGGPHCYDNLTRFRNIWIRPLDD